MTDAIRIGGYLPWGLAGLVLGKSLVPKGGTSSRPGQAKPQPLPPKATSLSRPEQEGMEAKTQGRKSQDGITRESELLNNFKGHHGPLAGANMGQSPSPQVQEPNHSKGLNRSRPGGP